MTKKVVSVVLAVMMVVSMMTVMGVATANAAPADFSTDKKVVFLTDSQNWDSAGTPYVYYWKVDTSYPAPDYNKVETTTDGGWVKMTYLYDNTMSPAQSVYGVVLPDDANWVKFNVDSGNNGMETTDTKNVYNGSWFYVDDNKDCKPCSGSAFDNCDQTDSLSAAFVNNTSADRYYVLDGRYYFIDSNGNISQYNNVAELQVAEVVGGANDGQRFTTVDAAIEAAGENGQVKLISDIESYVNISSKKNTTLDLNGHTITNTNGTGIQLGSAYTANDPVFTIKDTSDPSTGGVIINKKYTGDGCISDSSGRKVVIEGGTYTSDGNALYVSSDEGWEIKGGTFNGDLFVRSDVEVTGGEFNGNVIQDSLHNYSTGEDVPADIEISGGTFTADVSAYTTAATYQNANGEVVAKQAGYIYDEGDLKAAAAAGGSWTLANDITVTSAALTNTTTTKKTGGYNYDDRLVVNADFTLDGDGNKITAGTGTDDKTLFYATGDTVKITLTDLTIDGNGTAARAVCGYQSSGGVNTNEITLTNVTVKNFTGTTYAGPVYAFGGTQLTLNNCTVVNNDITVDPSYPHANGDVWGGGASNITINGGTYDELYANGAAAQYSIDGGAVVKTMNIEVADAVCVNVDNATINNVVAESGTNNLQLNANQIVYTANSTVAVPNGYKEVDGVTAGTKTIVPKDYVAQVGETKYETFAEARNAIKNADPQEGTIKLLKNTSLDGYYGIFGDTTIDLNGFTLTGADNNHMLQVQSGANLTIVGPGSVVADEDYVAVCVLSGGSLEVKGGATISGNTPIYNIGTTTITNGTINSVSKGGTGIWNEGGATLTINGGTITTAANSWGVVVRENGTSVTMNGGTINAGAGSYGISGIGNSYDAGYSITVNGGTVTADGGLGIYHPNEGTLTISGGTITGATGVYVKAGTTNVTVSGGTIKGNGEAIAYDYYGNGGKPTGDALVIDNCNYPGGVPTVSITGGTFESDNAQAVASYTDKGAGDTAPGAVIGFVSGGNFSNEVPETYCAPGYEPKTENDPQTNMYTVQVDTNPLNQKIGNSIIKASQAAAQDGNRFDLHGTLDYTKGRILGVQKKEAIMTDVAGIGIRFIAEAETATLDDAREYGFEICKTTKTNTPEFAAADGFNKMAQYKDDPTKVVKVNCKGTSNTVVGGGYGDATDNSTAYKYVTLAVNDIPADQGVAVRFYVTDSNGITHYAKYVRAGDVNMYDGCCTSYANLG